jgi:predicted permease
MRRRRLRHWVIRFFAAATGRRDEQRLREEADDHIAFETEEHLRRGLAPAEARRQALLAFGSVEAFKERYRDQQSLPFVEHLVQDVRIALRRMRKAPGFTAAAIGTLALGLGLTSAALGLAHALFLGPLPVPGASRLAIVDQTMPDRPRTNGYGFSHPDYAYYRDHAREFADLAAHYSTSPMNVVTPAGPIGVAGAVVTSTYFNVLRLEPALGRFFSAEEDRVPDRHPVAVLSHDFWRVHFGMDRSVLGTVLRVNGTDFTVIGVAPEGFRGTMMGLLPNQIWIPTSMFRVGYRYCDGLSRNCAVVNVIGRLADGASIESAQAEGDVLARQLEAAFPDTNKGHGVYVRPARGIRISDQAGKVPIVALLASAAAIVLLVSSANVAGLLLARGLQRRREIAIRLALGAGRPRLVRLLLVESMTLAIAGCAAGVVVAIWATDLLRGLLGVSNLEGSLDPGIVLVGIGVAVVTGLLIGMAPALQATRHQTVPAMRDETAGAGSRRSPLRDGLIVAQVALSVVLLGASGLVVRSFVMVHRGPGFDPNAIVKVRLRPSLIGSTNERAWAFQRAVIERLEAMPGVVAASPAGVPAHWPSRPTQSIRLTSDTGDPARAFRTSTRLVGPRYFKALGVDVIEGREFDDRDAAAGPRAVIVNETLARHFWPTGGAVGRAVTIGDDGGLRGCGLAIADRCEVVGVVKDLQWISALEQPEPIAYLNYWQQDRSNSWAQDSNTHVRVSGDAGAMLPQIRQAIAAVDPDVPITDGDVLARALDTQFADVRTARTMLVTFGVLALGLSMIGLYASLAFSIGQRTREIAVRMALGASRIDVGGLVFRRGFALVSIGLGAGLAACVAGGPFLSHLLYAVSPRDPVALGVGPAVLTLVAALAISLPARRAVRQNPVEALRMD